MVPKLDFLGIGAQKAATSWLEKNMRNHPAIWLPPRKELHYFDRLSKNALPSNSLIERFFGKDNKSKNFRMGFIRDLGSGIIRRDLKITRWVFNYYFGQWNDLWYQSLFRMGEGKLKGEITPAYSTLDLNEVRKIQRLFPDLKIIFIMRNPVERAWSHVRFEWSRGALSNINDVDKIKKFVESPSQSLRSDYVRTINIWTSCFPIEQIHVGFYDKILNDSRGFLQEICGFLGVDKDIFSSSKPLINKVNVSKTFEIPIEIKYFLAEKYYPEIQKLNDLVGGYSSIWLKETEEILNF
jgi:hypothetical protein